MNASPTRRRVRKRESGVLSVWVVVMSSIMGGCGPTSQEHSLDGPIVIQTVNGDVGVLPVGTVLRYDSTFSEGFARYTVVVNVEGAPRLRLDESRPADRISPVIAEVPDGFTMTDDQLVSLLRQLRVSSSQAQRVVVQLEAPESSTDE